MAGDREDKVVRSYTLVFRRRWRIFRVQSWRIPLPGGLELRLLGYWLACLLALVLAGRLPVLGLIVDILPASVRFFVVPLLFAWGLSRWEIDGRAPHRALFGLAVWLCRARVVAAFRRVPRVGDSELPLAEIAVAPDLQGSAYPRGRIQGPAQILLRYPVAARRVGGRAPGGARGALRLRAASATPLRRGRTLSVPAGKEVRFE